MCSPRVQASDLFKAILFADDTDLFCSGDNLQQLLSDLKREIMNLKTWFDINPLTLNLTKKIIMLFGNYKEDTQIRLNIQRVNIEHVKENTFLGVIIDEKMNWKSHIQYVQKTVSKSIAILSKAKHVFDCQALCILYCSLFRLT